VYRLITTNHNYSSWSLRAWVLLKGLGIPFEQQVVPIDGVANFEPFRRFSPSGTLPALIDGETTVWDSLGITLYLADRHPGLWPDGEAAKTWARCIVAEMHGGFFALRNDCTMNVGARVRRKPDSAALIRDTVRISAIFEEGLSRFGGPFLAGPAFTAADAFYAPVVFRIRTYDLEVGRLGRGWVERMLALAPMREWEQLALAEPYRSIGHEQELAAAGAIVEDFRAVAA
jgi:glutathione S-transferase